MGYVIKIPQDIRKKMLLGVLEYAVADCIACFKKPCTYQEIAEVLDETVTDVGEIVEMLNDLSLVEIAPRSGKVSTTKIWKEQTKIEKEVKEPNPLIHLMHLALISPERRDKRLKYYWTPRDARDAEELSKKLRYSFEETKDTEPTNEEVIASFCLILDNLLPFYVDKFTIGRINSDYNGVIGEVKAILKGKKSQGKIIDSAQSIREASDDFTPLRFQ